MYLIKKQFFMTNMFKNWMTKSKKMIYFLLNIYFSFSWNVIFLFLTFFFLLFQLETSWTDHILVTPIRQESWSSLLWKSVEKPNRLPTCWSFSEKFILKKLFEEIKNLPDLHYHIYHLYSSSISRPSFHHSAMPMGKTSKKR